MNGPLASLVEGCGYSGGVPSAASAANGVPELPYAATLPPRDPYALRTLRHLILTTTLAELRGYVTHAEEHGGG